MLSEKQEKMPTVIGINGIAGAGKDTVAQMVALSLSTNHKMNVQHFAFAHNLKHAASIIFNVPIEHFHDRDLKEVVIPYWGMSPRQMAQKLGTEACRRGIRDDIWIKSLESLISKSDADIVFITDVRFDNEAEFASKYGIVINIERDTQERIKDSDHASEAGISSEYITYKIKNITGNPFFAAAELQKVILSLLDNSKGDL